MELLSDEEPHAIVTHCYGHELNLSISDCVKQYNVMKAALNIVVEVNQKSPKRDAAFEKLKA